MTTKASKLDTIGDLIQTQFGNELRISKEVGKSDESFLQISKRPLTSTSSYSETTENAISMNYLPLFYVIASLEKDEMLSLKLITHHGKILEDLKYFYFGQPCTNRNCDLTEHDESSQVCKKN